MNRILVLLALISVYPFQLEAGSVRQKVEKYIDQYKHIAIEDMHTYGIPASIKLGQALLESAYGSSELATNANNHFGIKCKRHWTGPSYRYTDDAPDECFRSYKSPEQSFRDHSTFLKYHRLGFYDALFDYSVYDYKSWARGLKKAGYATNPKYTQILISLIERYELYRYDTALPSSPFNIHDTANCGPIKTGQLTNFKSNKRSILYQDEFIADTKEAPKVSWERVNYKSKFKRLMSKLTTALNIDTLVFWR